MFSLDKRSFSSSSALLREIRSSALASFSSLPVWFTLMSGHGVPSLHDVYCAPVYGVLSMSVFCMR